MQSRDTRIDVLKGIGILFIIMGHCGGHGRQFLNYTLFHGLYFLLHLAMFLMKMIRIISLILRIK